jgi:phage terminase large subunit-like protein
MNYVQEYIDKIRSSEIITGKKVKQLYFNIIEPVLRGDHPKYYFDEKKGEKFIKFVEGFCRQSKGEWCGKPIKLLLFQKAKYQAIFGILRRSDGRRRFREVFDVRGRKNGKSTENAALGLYLELIEPGAEIYVAATVAGQARRVWEESQSIIDQSEDLQEEFGYKVFPSPEIYTKNGKSKYKVLSKNVKQFDGLNASGAIIDEVHELPRQIYDILQQSTSARREALLSMITTAGFVRGALYDDTYDYATKVLDGVVEDDTFYPLIYELDDPKEIDDEACWIKANPALDVIKNRDALRRNVIKMKTDLNFANTVKTKDFNILGIENKAWLAPEDFIVTDCYTDEELKQFDNTIVLGGFDLSRTGDMTAFNTLLFDKVKHRPIAITMYWITKKYYDEQIQSNSKIPWSSFVDRGLVRISGTNIIDYHDIAQYVVENFKNHGWMYQFINYDSWSAPYLIEELVSMGYSKDTCLIPTHQGAKTLSIPMQTLEAHLKEKIICYQNNPVTKWCLSNVQLEQDRNGNYMPKKNDDRRERKIDGVATILNCYVSLCANMDFYLNE